MQKQKRSLSGLYHIVWHDEPDVIRSYRIGYKDAPYSKTSFRREDHFVDYWIDRREDARSGFRTDEFVIVAPVGPYYFLHQPWKLGPILEHIYIDAGPVDISGILIAPGLIGQLAIADGQFELTLDICDDFDAPKKLIDFVFYYRVRKPHVNLIRQSALDARAWYDEFMPKDYARLPSD